MSTVTFVTADGNVTAEVFKCLTPWQMDFSQTDGINVVLLQETTQDAAGATIRKYALMVDDPYWGRRLQPSEPQAAPFAEQFVLGWCPLVRVMDGAEPVRFAFVSARLIYKVHGSDTELVGQAEPVRWIPNSGGTAAILMTDGQGRVRQFRPGQGLVPWLLPMYHGAITQRATDLRDASASNAALARWVDRVEVWYHGHMVEVKEGQEAEIELHSSTVTATCSDPDGAAGIGAHLTYDHYLLGHIWSNCIGDLDFVTGHILKGWYSKSGELDLPGDDLAFAFGAADAVAPTMPSGAVLLIYDYEEVELASFDVYAWITAGSLEPPAPPPQPDQWLFVGSYGFGDTVLHSTITGLLPENNVWMGELCVAAANMRTEGFCAVGNCVVNLRLRARWWFAPGTTWRGDSGLWHPKATLVDFPSPDRAFYVEDSDELLAGQYWLTLNAQGTFLWSDPLPGNHAIDTSVHNAVKYYWWLRFSNGILAEAVANAFVTDVLYSATAPVGVPSTTSAPEDTPIICTSGGVIRGNVVRHHAGAPIITEQSDAEEVWRTRIDECAQLKRFSEVRHAATIATQ